jgi:hypothetical protein
MYFLDFFGHDENKVLATNDCLYMLLSMVPISHRPASIEEWWKVEKMLDELQKLEGKAIKIVKAPGGSDPEIAKSWIGVTIPFSSGLVPMIYVTEELEKWGMGSVEKNDVCYSVSGETAMAELEKLNPAGAALYKAYRPNWQQDMTLIFDGAACEVVDAPKLAETASDTFESNEVVE